MKTFYMQFVKFWLKELRVVEFMCWQKLLSLGKGQLVRPYKGIFEMRMEEMRDMRVAERENVW